MPFFLRRSLGVGAAWLLRDPAARTASGSQQFRRHALVLFAKHLVAEFPQRRDLKLHEGLEILPSGFHEARYVAGELDGLIGVERGVVSIGCG